MAFKVDEKVIIELRFCINPSRTPKHVDFTSANGEVLRGIYSLNDNFLTLCWPIDADTPRPQLLLNAPDKDYATFTLERVKP